VAEYVDEGAFPLSREQLWAFLDQHWDPAVIGQIHPDIVAQKVLNQRENGAALERTIRYRGKDLRSVWTVTWRRPDFIRWEIGESAGPMASGSYLENAYSDAPGGTYVRSHGEITVTGLPKFLMRRIVRTAMGTIDNEDREFLAKQHR
jgi:hypothetical protein